MKYKFYLQNDLPEASLPDGYEKFYTVVDISLAFELSRHYYHGDDIRYKLDIYKGSILNDEVF